MIYHFCNDSFGVPFALASARIAKAERLALTLVYDGSGPVAFRARLSRAFDELRRRLDNSAMQCIYVANVNSEGFRSRLRPGDAGIVTGFRQIFEQKTIERFGSLVNLHPSLLPHYRGPAPTKWCIERGETRTGYTLHEVTPRIDQGPILFQEIVPIEPGDTALTLATRIALAALPVFERYLRTISMHQAWDERRVESTSVYRNPVAYRSHS